MTGSAPDRCKESGQGAVVYVTRALLGDLARRAAENPRGRINHNFHEPSDGYQRMLNVIQPGSYIRPHAHLEQSKSESFVVLKGAIGFFRFSPDGEVLEACRLGPGHDAVGVDLHPGVWHTFLALEPDTVVFEGKNGPYDPATDKTFPDWAPAEGDSAAQGYAQGLLAALD